MCTRARALARVCVCVCVRERERERERDSRTNADKRSVDEYTQGLIINVAGN